MLQRIRERRRTLGLAALASMTVAAVVGAFAGLFALATMPTVPKAMKVGLNTAAVVFWVLFVVEMVIELCRPKSATR